MPSLKIDDFYDLRFLGNINVANGRIFFEIFRPVEKANKYESDIVELKDGKTVKYTRGNEDRDMAIDLTGFMMAYRSAADKKTSVFIKNLETGEERKIWETDSVIKKMYWDRKSKGLYIISQEKPKDEDFRIFEKYPLYFNGEGFFPTVNYRLLHLLLNGKVQKVFDEDGEIVDIAINPSKDEIAVIDRPDGWDIYDSRIGFLDLSTRNISYLDEMKGGFSSPVYDQDGTLYFLHSRHERSIFESPKIFIFKGGEIHNLLERFDLSPENSVNSDSRMGMNRLIAASRRYVYFVATFAGRAGIYRVSDGKEPEKVLAGDFSVDSFDLSGDRIFYIAQSSDTPQEVYSFNGNIERLTNINSRIERMNLRRAKNFKFTASDGREIEGWFLKGHGKGTILEIHGGPRTSYGEGFMLEFHLLNSLGFDVLYSNPRGSDGYGDEFALMIKGKYGERDYRDILEVVDYAHKNFGIRKENMGVIGGSYGGFMVNWIVGHTSQFKAAVTDRSISDQISFYFSSDIGPRFNSDQIGGSPYDDIEHYWAKSPVRYMKNVKTPVLIIHSEEDYRCPIWQAYEMFTQLKREGSEVRMISFKGENHDLSRGGKPKNRVKRLTEISRWFEEKIR